jgi:hypothetical protein
MCRAAGHQAQGRQGEDPRHLRAGRPAAIHAARLRRTAATLAGDLGFDDAWIAKCLDHSASKKEDQATVPSVTGRVYNHSKRMKESARCWTGSQSSCGGSLASQP